jgi:hypothetical protein
MMIGMLFFWIAIVALVAFAAREKVPTPRRMDTERRAPGRSSRIGSRGARSRRKSSRAANRFLLSTRGESAAATNGGCLNQGSGSRLRAQVSTCGVPPELGRNPLSRSWTRRNLSGSRNVAARAWRGGADTERQRNGQPRLSSGRLSSMPSEGRGSPWHVTAWRRRRSVSS